MACQEGHPCCPQQSKRGVINLSERYWTYLVGV